MPDAYLLRSELVNLKKACLRTFHDIDRVLEQLQTHAGIVGFHGWMKKEQGGKRCEYWMLLEYCANGSLVDLLYTKKRGGGFEKRPRMDQARRARRHARRDLG